MLTKRLFNLNFEEVYKRIDKYVLMRFEFNYFKQGKLKGKFNYMYRCFELLKLNLLAQEQANISVI